MAKVKDPVQLVVVCICVFVIQLREIRDIEQAGVVVAVSETLALLSATLGFGDDCGDVLPELLGLKLAY